MILLDMVGDEDYSFPAFEGSAEGVLVEVSALASEV
jgi:hypothetical protein